MESRAEEFREQEPLDEGQPDDEVDARADLARSIEPSVFPARPGELLESAERTHAPVWVTEALRRLPDNLYETTEAVWEAVAAI